MRKLEGYLSDSMRKFAAGSDRILTIPHGVKTTIQGALALGMAFEKLSETFLLGVGSVFIALCSYSLHDSQFCSVLLSF